MAIDPVATGFDRAAIDYERSRPDYPSPAVGLVCERLGLRPGVRLLDVGAGTGKLTRDLVPTGAEVVAVEPVAGMRAQLRRVLPDLEILDGTAESLPLPDRSVHAAVAAQAFHWFDGPAALAELSRVLVPDAWFAVLHNRRDTTTPVQAALDELLAPHARDVPSWGRNDWPDALTSPPSFTDVEVHEFPHAQRLDAAGMAARVASISFVARMDDRTRNSILSAVGALFDVAHDDGVVDLQYVTEVRLLRRRGEVV